jgi:hypothetical protein
MLDLRGRNVRHSVRRALGGAWIGLGTFGPLALAHHSISAVYDVSRREQVEGVVAEFQFVNPHPFVIVTVAGDAGPEAWRLELDNRFELVRIGISADTLKPGDRVVATGSGGREDMRSLYVRRLERPLDGLLYEQVGSSPRVTGLP